MDDGLIYCHGVAAPGCFRQDATVETAMDRRSFLTLPLLAISPASQDPRMDRGLRESAQRILRGLRRIGVQVNVFGEISRLLDTGLLQTRTELKLRQLAVPVVSGSLVPEEPTLMLMVVSHEFAPGMFVVDQTLELIERVTVPRLGNPNSLDYIPGSTWGGNSNLLMATSATAATDVEEIMVELAEQFANDYLAANPK
ncbi:MAG: hypothetical protein A3F70_18150 [Acidobacteria bacterium RIFCSPLOWO2_12_FULL_67_14]|nr:MAG: hypothetical protein A3F70_18150 [Acidobacteria bacterium RIFCSPLOWO2_12_FULL_67_14]